MAEQLKIDKVYLFTAELVNTKVSVTEKRKITLGFREKGGVLEKCNPSDIYFDDDDYPTIKRSFDAKTYAGKQMEFVSYREKDQETVLSFEVDGTKMDTGDDYYDERGQFLYHNMCATSNIRLIDNADFEAIKVEFKSELEDTEHSYADLTEALENASKVVTNTITGSDFESMLKDSNLDSNITSPSDPNRRMEQVALILLDKEKNEIKLDRQASEKGDKINIYDGGHIHNTSPYYDELGHFYWWNPTIQDTNYEVYIIGIVHTHPINYLGEEMFSKIDEQFLDPRRHITDNDRTTEMGNIANYQIYPETINQVDKAYRHSLSTDNITTTLELLNNEFDMGKDALETFGKKK